MEKKKKLIYILGFILTSFIIVKCCTSCCNFGHTYGEMIPEVPVTCTEDGIRAHYECSECHAYFDENRNEIYSIVIPATGHDYGELISEVSATCTEEGIKTHYECSKCHAYFDENMTELSNIVIPASGHEYGEIIPEVPSTCTEDGIKAHYECSRCHAYFDENMTELSNIVIPASGHDYGEIIPEVPATCTEDGIKAHYECSRCHKLYDENMTETSDLVIPATGHSKGELISIYENAIEGINNPGSFNCTKCNYQYCDEILYTDISLPMLSLYGDFTDISKENKVKLDATYYSSNLSIESECKLKLQGSSSINYPKKNYNIQFYVSNSDYKDKMKVQFQDNWPSESKYTLKANWIDATHARNIVSAKLYGEIVKEYSDLAELESLVNGGAIDGFPIVLFENGAFAGLYTLNLAKEDYLFGMGENVDSQEAILTCNSWSSQGRLCSLLDDELTGYELEYCSTEDTSWVKESFNHFITFLNDSTDEEFMSKINDYTDLDLIINQMLFTYIIRAQDNSSKNILWITYDGVKWYPSMYDMDGTWGASWDGSISKYSSAWIPKESSSSNALYKRIWDNYASLVADCYNDMRKDVLSLDNVFSLFSSFNDLIPSYVWDAEHRKWDIPNVENNTVDQITDYMIKYFEILDEYFIALSISLE